MDVSIPLMAGECSVRSEDEVGEESFGADIHEETDIAGGLLTLGLGDCQGFSSVDRHLYLSVDVDLWWIHSSGPMSAPAS